jgi:hypothetical protein
MSKAANWWTRLSRGMSMSPVADWGLDMKKTYEIVVWWSEGAVCKVDAESLEDAKSELVNNPGQYVPEHGDYIDESLTIDEDQTEEFNK